MVCVSTTMLELLPVTTIWQRYHTKGHLTALSYSIFWMPTEHCWSLICYAPWKWHNGLCMKSDARARDFASIRTKQGVKISNLYQPYVNFMKYSALQHPFTWFRSCDILLADNNHVFNILLFWNAESFLRFNLGQEPFSCNF